MPNPVLEIDPASEASGSPLVITTGNYGLTSFDPGSPSFRHQFVSSVDSEGAAVIPGQPDNRILRIGLDVTGDAALYALEGKLGKLHREGGTIRYTNPAGVALTWARSPETVTPMRIAVALALAAVTVALVACADDADEPRDTTAGTPARSESSPSSTAQLRLVALEPLNRSGVRGMTRLLVDEATLAVAQHVTGASQGQLHMQHIHLPEGNADGTCPTRALDANGDGIVTLEEGAPAYGAPAISLEPFPRPDGPAFGFAATLAAPRGLELDRGVVVLHGRKVRGKYDPLLPIACGAIAEADVREIALEPVNNSGIAGTARLARTGDELLAWVAIGGPIDGQEHMQHLHLPEGGGAGSCPTPDLDKDGDGLVSLEEGVPAYGDPAVSLEPFPVPKDILHHFMARLRVDSELPLDRTVLVVHGMDVDGTYDETIPVACGARDRRVDGAGQSDPGSGPTGRDDGYGL